MSDSESRISRTAPRELRDQETWEIVFLDETGARVTVEQFEGE